MVQLKHSEKRILEDALDMGSGYVLNFSDRTFAEFFDDQGITIYQEKYAFNGSSKAKHMRAFVQVENAFTVCRVLRELWEHRESIPQYQQADATGQLKARFFALLDKPRAAAKSPALTRSTGSPATRRSTSSWPRSSATSEPIGRRPPSTAFTRTA
jgi:hypothetical protein